MRQMPNTNYNALLSPSISAPNSITSWIGLGLGPILAILVWYMLPNVQLDPAGIPIGGLTNAARATGAVTTLMACWWLTEAIPLSATALLPLILFPIGGVLSFSGAAAPYASEVIFLFMGGFILGLAMQRCGLHKRIALIIVQLVGTNPKRLVGGFMLASATISMWVSNTATAIMMLPIALSIIALVRQRAAPPNTPEDKLFSPDPNFDSSLLLGVAYAASIGGIATFIGSPPNAVFKGFAEAHFNNQIGFTDWMKTALPIVIIYLPLAWIYITSISQPIHLKNIPGGKAMIRGELDDLGPMNPGEWVVFLVFLLTVALWVFRPTLVNLGTTHGIQNLHALNDATIALFSSLLLFIIPTNPKKRVFAMDWQTAEQLPWGTLILFGGGLSLAAAITSSGLDVYIGQFFTGLAGLPAWLIVLTLVTVVIFASELASNTAIATAILPILAAAAPSMGIDPYRLLIPATIAASMAFMLPVGTPPNAIVYATGRVTTRQMIRAGFGLNLLAIVIITLITELMGNSMM